MVDMVVSYQQKCSLKNNQTNCRHPPPPHPPGPPPSPAPSPPTKRLRFAIHGHEMLLFFLLLYFPDRALGITILLRFCTADCFATLQVFTFQLQVMVLVEKTYPKKLVKGQAKWTEETRNNRKQKNKGGNRQERGNKTKAPEIPRQQMNLFHYAWAHHRHITKQRNYNTAFQINLSVHRKTLFSCSDQLKMSLQFHCCVWL